MKTLLITIILGLIITACCSSCTQDNELAGMSCPVTVISKTDSSNTLVIIDGELEGINYGSVTLQSGGGKVRTYSCKNLFGASIWDTYDVGDTVKKCN